MRRTWFEGTLDWIARLPGPTWAFVVGGTAVVAIPLHLAELVDGRPLILHPDLLIGAATPGLFAWLAIELNRVAVRALARLRPALDLDGPTEAEIAADLVHTPNVLALSALVIGAIGGVTSVVESPGNWGVDLALPGARLYGAIILSVVTDVLLLGLLAHIVHQLRVVMRVHRTVRVDLFRLEPLYAFSTLTAWTSLSLLALIVGLIAFLSLSIGKFLLVGAADIALTAVIAVLAVACFVVPLLGLHRRIADAKAAKYLETQATTSAVIEAVRVRVAAGDLDAAAKLKDALLAADASVAAVVRISTWPWHAETLRGFVSAVLLPIGLFVTYELLRRVLT